MIDLAARLGQVFAGVIVFGAIDSVIDAVIVAGALVGAIAALRRAAKAVWRWARKVGEAADVVMHLPQRLDEGDRRMAGHSRQLRLLDERLARIERSGERSERSGERLERAVSDSAAA